MGARKDVEGFEIVRRRLFEPIVEQPQFVARDTVSRVFYDFYKNERDDFPTDSRESDYERKLKTAYPIHPEVFNRLYSDWSTLVKFQRTRGVLRLMAAVIHGLWEKGDRNSLILPASIPIEDPRVQFELTRYLSDIFTVGIPQQIVECIVNRQNYISAMQIDIRPSIGRCADCRLSISYAL